MLTRCIACIWICVLQSSIYAGFITRLDSNPQIATGIRNLEIDGAFYNVDFTSAHLTFQQMIGHPTALPEFYRQHGENVGYAIAFEMFPFRHEITGVGGSVQSSVGVINVPTRDIQIAGEYYVSFNEYDIHDATITSRLRFNYQNITGIPIFSPVGAVPEPSAAIMVLTCLLLLVFSVVRKQYSKSAVHVFR